MASVRGATSRRVAAVAASCVRHRLVDAPFPFAERRYDVFDRLEDVGVAHGPKGIPGG